MRELFLLAAFAVGLAMSDDSDKFQKNIGVFNVIKFENTACQANDAKNGTCYTKDECDQKRGTPSGSCANGYGVCCTFIMGCGSRRAENSSYFESSKGFVGQCNAHICKCHVDVCQLRLDFTSFTLTGPSVLTTSQELLLAGIISGAVGIGVSDKTRCLTDQFHVTSPGSMSSPTICGINTGAHMYIDASEACNTLSFQIGTSSGTANREWAIKITQFACDYHNLAPDGCLQYFYGSVSGNVQTFNFEGGTHLGDQDQNICIRREKNMCRICWSNAPDDFVVSHKIASMGFVGKSSLCCGYGTDGMKTTGYDCVIIPMATLKATLGKVVSLNGDEFCGQNLVTVTGTTAATVCSMSIPFHIRFLSDAWEYADEAVLPMVGFRLHYHQYDNCMSA